MTAPTQLTGADVRLARETYRLSRQAFVTFAGLPGVSRLYNIEVNDSWKDGDRERVTDALARLSQRAESDEPVPSPPRTGTTRRPRRRDATPESSVNGSGVVVVVDALEDLDEGVLEELATVDLPDDVDPLAADAYAEAPRRVDLVDLPSPVYGASVLDVPAGTYVSSNSETETFKRCPRKWWLGWYRRLTLRAADRTGPLATGDRVHRALACWYVPDGQTRVDPRDALERIIVDDWTAVANVARERGLDETQLAELANRFQDANSLERAMIEGYVQWLQETGADSEYRIVGAEQAIYWDTQVDPYEHVHSSNGSQLSNAHRLRDVRVIARLDTRVQRISDGAWLFKDHKTCADLKTPQKTLHGNPQMLTYLVLEWLNTAEGEARCDGALYNMLRKVKRTQRANPPFFERVEVRHNVHELENHKRELLAWTRQVLRAVDALDTGADPHDVVPRTWRDDCSWSCDFFPVCPMFDDGSRVEDALSGLYVEHDPRLRYNDLERFEPPRATS